MMIDVFDEDGQFGQNRAELMGRFTQILMEWAKAKCAPEQWLAAEVQAESLAVLAFEMLERVGSGTVVETDKIKTVMPPQVQTDPNWPPRPSPPDQVLKLAADANIIEMPVDRSSVRFYHQLLQEYFTARFVVGNASKGTLKRLINNHLTDDRWREVFLLTASLLDDADIFFNQFNQAIDELISGDEVLVGMLRWIKRKGPLESPFDKPLVSRLILCGHILIKDLSIIVSTLPNVAHYQNRFYPPSSHCLYPSTNYPFFSWRAER
jgi:hypothetical protein